MNPQERKSPGGSGENRSQQTRTTASSTECEVAAGSGFEQTPPAARTPMSATSAQSPIGGQTPTSSQTPTGSQPPTGGQTPTGARSATGGPTAGQAPTGSPTGGRTPTGSMSDHSSEGSTKEQMKEKARHVAAEAAEAARETAAGAAERLKQEGDQWTDRQTTRAAEEISHLTHAMREAASSLHEDSDHNVAAAIEYAADTADQAANYLRNCDRRRLQRDAEQFARRRPEIFYGGMFLAGLAISRFLKASSASASPEYGSEGWDRDPFDHAGDRQSSREYAASSSWE